MPLPPPDYTFPEIQDLGDYVEPEESSFDESASEPVPDESADVPGADADPGTAPETPADSAPAADPGVEDKPAAPKQEPGDAGKKAEMWDQWADRWARDPVGFMQNFLQHMTPEQQAALTGQAPPQPPNDAPPWEPQSDAEAHYAKHYKAVENLPTFAQNVEQAFQTRDRFINDAHIELAIQRAQIDTLLTLMETTLPQVDQKALAAALADGKTSYRDAVDKLYRPHLDKAAAQKKQAARPRPTTPGNASGETLHLPKNADMATIFRAMSGK